MSGFSRTLTGHGDAETRSRKLMKKIFIVATLLATVRVLVSAQQPAAQEETGGTQ